MVTLSLPSTPRKRPDTLPSPACRQSSDHPCFLNGTSASGCAPESSLDLITKWCTTPHRDKPAILGMSFFISLHSEQAPPNWWIQRVDWSNEHLGTWGRRGLEGPHQHSPCVCFLRWLSMTPHTHTHSPSLSITSPFLVSFWTLFTFCNYFSADCFTHHGGHSMREGGHLLFLLTTYFPEPGMVSGA